MVGDQSGALPSPAKQQIQDPTYVNWAPFPRNMSLQQSDKNRKKISWVTFISSWCLGQKLDSFWSLDTKSCSLFYLDFCRGVHPINFSQWVYFWLKWATDLFCWLQPKNPKLFMVALQSILTAEQKELLSWKMGSPTVKDIALRNLESLRFQALKVSLFKPCKVVCVGKPAVHPHLS